MSAWRTTEEAFMREHYAAKDNAWIAAQLGRSVGAVRSRAKRIGLRKSDEFMVAMHKEPRRKPLTDDQMRLWLLENVRIDGECRIWAGTVVQGVPVVRWKGRMLSARRLLPKLMGKQIGPREVVYPCCGNGLCLNPQHLRIDTRKRMAGVYKRLGKWASGPRMSIVAAKAGAHRAKIGLANRGAVEKMRAEGRTWAEIGAHFGVSASTAHQASKTWRRVLGVRVAA